MSELRILVDSVTKNFELPLEKNSLKQTIIHPSKWFKPKTQKLEVLKDINIEVKDGEFLGIVGRNGSGKSTLLKLMAEIYQPTEGEIKISGKLLPFIELGVGFNPELTGKENVYLSGALLGFSKEDIDKKYKRIVEFAELEKFMNQRLKNYSSGMQVRLAFSIATQSEADILLIDEVLAVGDSSFQKKCFNYFKTLKKRKRTVVFVTHDMDAVNEYCDRAILIEDGEILKEGATKDVSEAYRRLFSDNSGVAAQSASTVEGKNEDRWGSGEIRFEKVAVEHSQDNIKIKLSLKGYAKTEDYVVGVRVRDASGKDILGTNTFIESFETGLLKKGEETEIAFEIKNILSDGQYIVDPAIVKNNKIDVIDWWNNAASFENRRDRHVPYSVYPDFKVYSVGRKKK